MEAVIAAIYKDGGFEIAKTIIIKLWGDRIKNVKVDARDAKTMLQEWAQARGQNPPNYEVISRSGLIMLRFSCKSNIGLRRNIRSYGRSKRQAEQMAQKHFFKK